MGQSHEGLRGRRTLLTRAAARGDGRFPGRRRLAALALLVASSSAAANAQPAPVTITHDPLLEPTLQQLDLATGDLAAIGPLGLGQRAILAIAWLPSGELVAVDDLARELLRIDPATGQGTVAGGLGIDQPGTFLIDLAADTCGRLWLTVVVNPGEQYLLYQVDPDTGAAKLHGPLPTPVSGLAAHGETLYGLSRAEGTWRIVRIDPETSTVTPVAEIEGLSDFFRTVALDFDDFGDLIALGAVVPPIPVPILPGIVRFDLDGGFVFGEQVEVPPGMSPAVGLAVAAPPGACPEGSPLPIPAASPAGLVTLAAGLGVAGSLLLALRRRRARV